MNNEERKLLRRIVNNYTLTEVFDEMAKVCTENLDHLQTCKLDCETKAAKKEWKWKVDVLLRARNMIRRLRL